MIYFSGLILSLRSSLTKSATDEYSGCFFRNFNTCSYSGSGIDICRYPLAMIEIYGKHDVNVLIDTYSKCNRKIYMHPYVYSKYGRKSSERGENERI